MITGGAEPPPPHFWLGGGGDSPPPRFLRLCCSANSIGILFVHSWKNVPKSETNFWKQCIITEQWNTVMTPNFAHKIVHSSAMYYQNLIIIHESSKKLLKMKNSKSVF